MDSLTYEEILRMFSDFDLASEEKRLQILATSKSESATTGDSRIQYFIRIGSSTDRRKNSNAELA